MAKRDGSRLASRASCECTESQCPPGQVWMPMLARSAAEKLDRTRLFRSMKVRSREAPVQGFRGSFLDASRPFFVDGAVGAALVGKGTVMAYLR